MGWLGALNDLYSWDVIAESALNGLYSPGKVALSSYRSVAHRVAEEIRVAPDPVRSNN